MYLYIHVSVALSMNKLLISEQFLNIIKGHHILALMSRIACKYCLIGTSYLAGLFEVFYWELNHS